MTKSRRFWLALWLVPLAAVTVFHFAAAQPFRRMDTIGDHVQSARNLLKQEQYSPAVAEFDKALEVLPDDSMELRRELQLEQAQAKMNASRLPEAHGDLKKLLDELLDEDDATEDFENRVRESLASSQYYMTWLMRLEGLSRDEWEPEIESARQNYRLLAERATDAGNAKESKTQLENLESSIRLARLDLTDLQGLPLPSQ
jgi:tetratricopeptide (TPR) repeat protein